MQTSQRSNKIRSILCYLLAVMLVLLPFHATLTVWLASNFGHYTLFRVWIEVVIAVLFADVGYLVMRQKVVLANSRARLLGYLSVAYVLLHLILGMVALGRHAVNFTSLADGLVLNLRLIAIFWLAIVIASGNSWLRT